MPVLTILGVLGVVLAAGYILWMIQRTFYGPVLEQYNKVVELWTRATDDITQAVKGLLDPESGLGAMATSGTSISVDNVYASPTGT
jgi:hypothetical protein